MANHVTKIPRYAVVVHRKGKAVRPEIGKPFEFTQEEADELGDNLRDPINETGAAPAPAATSAPELKGKSTGGKVSDKAGEDM